MMSKPRMTDESDEAEQAPKTRQLTPPDARPNNLINGISEASDGQRPSLNGHTSQSDFEEDEGCMVSNDAVREFDHGNLLNHGIQREESDSDEGCEADSANGPVLPPRPINMGLMARNALHTSNGMVSQHLSDVGPGVPGRHWPSNGLQHSKPGVCTRCGRQRQPRSVQMNSHLPESLWHELEREGLVAHGFNNHMNSFSHMVHSSEPNNDMESYFNTNAHLLNMPADATSSPEDNSPSVFGDDWADAQRNETGDSPVEEEFPSETSNSHTVTCTKLSTSSEDQGDFIETDLSLTPRMGSSSYADSKESSTEDLLDVEGGNDEGVCVQCTNKAVICPLYDGHPTARTLSNSITSHFRCNCDEPCDDVNLCQHPVQCKVSHGCECPPVSSSLPCDLELSHSHCRLCRQSSKDGQKDEGIMDGTTSESSSYFSPDLDIDVLDFDIDTPPNARGCNHVDDEDDNAYEPANSSSGGAMVSHHGNHGGLCASQMQNNIVMDDVQEAQSGGPESSSNIAGDEERESGASRRGDNLTCLTEALSVSANERVVSAGGSGGCSASGGCCDAGHHCEPVEAVAIGASACRCNDSTMDSDHPEVFCTVCFQNNQNSRDEEIMSVPNHASNNLGMDGGESGHCSEMEDELYNVSRQTSTSNFDQDENSFQEEEDVQTWQPCCTCGYHDNAAASGHSNITADNVYDEFLKNIKRGKMRYKNNNYKDIQQKWCQSNTDSEMGLSDTDSVDNADSRPNPSCSSRAVLLRQPCMSDDGDVDDDDDSPEMPARSSVALEMSRLAASSRASTWPRCNEDESPISALKLLEYEFSTEGTNWNRRVFSTAGRFALSDDDSPINAAHLLPQNSVTSSTDLDERTSSSSKDDDQEEYQESDTKKKSCKGRTDKTHMLLHLRKEVSDGGKPSKDAAPPGSVMIWSEYEAYILQVKQIGTSACGATAVINVLKAFDFYVDKKIICDTIKTNLRAEHSPLPEYLLSRSSAGTTADCLIQGIDRLTNGALYGRFFSFFPTRNVDIFSWLAGWINKGAVPLMTLNLQKQHGSTAGWGWAIPDAWHHQMCYGLTPAGAYLTNPLQVVPFSLLREQLTSDRVLLVRRQDIISRWGPDTNLSLLLQIPDPRWRQMNVLGQVINVLREANMPRMPGFRPQLTTHVSIPAWYQAGITLFVKRESPVYEELRDAPELPLQKDSSEEKS